MVSEIQVFHSSGQTHSPAYELQRGSWAATAPLLCEKSPASLKWWSYVPERSLKSFSFGTLLQKGRNLYSSDV